MHVLRAAALAALATTAVAAPAAAVPPPFAVCVVTADANGYARLDSYWSVEADAQLRRRELLTVDPTWVTGVPLPGPEQTQPDREYEYPRHALLKVFVDPTLVNESACMPPTATAAAAGAER